MMEPLPTAEYAHVVCEEDLASALSSGAEQYPPVLATTRAIALCELAAGRALVPLLAPGQLSVGVEVDVRHLAATPPGGAVTAVATYRGREGKLYAFDVVVRDAGGEVMRGRHTRAIVTLERLLSGARERVK
jgi:fluoroacetyl-CoA thioesterase